MSWLRELRCSIIPLLIILLCYISCSLKMRKFLKTTGFSGKSLVCCFHAFRECVKIVLNRNGPFVKILQRIISVYQSFSCRLLLNTGHELTEAAIIFLLDTNTDISIVRNKMLHLVCAQSFTIFII